METVTVPAGTFNSLRVDLVMTFRSSDLDADYEISDWFAPDVGMVKSSAGSDYGSFTLELESYAIP